MMQYTLDHVVIAVPDVRASASAYQAQFGSRIRLRAPGEAWLQHDGPAPLVLREGDEAPGIRYAAYRVDSAHAACDDLTSKGVRRAWDLADQGSVQHCGFYDADGLPFQVFSTPADEPRTWTTSRPAMSTALRFHHVNILTPDVRRAIQFYEQVLGLWVALAYQPDFSGFNLLIDRAFDDHEHNIMLEITGPPGLDEREAAYLATHGPCYDHICFSTADPAATYHRLVDNGAPPLYEPVDYYGNVLAWVEDPQRVHVELMKPISTESLAGVLRGGPPLCFTTLTYEGDAS